LEDLITVEVQETGIGVSPIDSLSLLVNQTSSSFDKVVEEAIVVSNLVENHPCVDWDSVPAASKDLITSEVDGVPREIVGEVLPDVSKQVVGGIFGGIKLTEWDTSVPDAICAGNEA